MHIFPYRWNLSDGYPAKGIKKNNLKVFGTFICGGGSTMGYKLAGFSHLGGVEIDPECHDIYRVNHAPKLLYLEDIRDFNKREDLPSELFDLDILDGSPPCSTFSIAGSRESAWGKEKVFREGQAKQRLDDLVFIYTETINKLKPKVAILENVKGMIAGNAKTYVKEVVRRLNGYGYDVQIFLFNAASMGVPQKRERVFFICSRQDLHFPKLTFNFNEPSIYFGEIEKQCVEPLGKKLSPAFYRWWLDTPKGKSLSFNHPKGSFFNSQKICSLSVLNTITSTVGAKMIHHTYPHEIGKEALEMCGSYPMDYDFKHIDPKYLIGMSVPPVMTAQIAHQINLQWFDKSLTIKEKKNGRTQPKANGA
jgi:DNA (cytosine-5)-methyltransferase 1